MSSRCHCMHPIGTMTTEAILDELTDAAERMDIDVRVEKGDFRGGRCHVGEETIIMLNKRHPASVRLNVLAQSLKDESLDTIYLKPAVRETLHRLWNDTENASTEATEKDAESKSDSSESPRAHAS